MKLAVLRSDLTIHAVHECHQVDAVLAAVGYSGCEIVKIAKDPRPLPTVDRETGRVTVQPDEPIDPSLIIETVRAAV